jgi:hypothetical protein
MAKSRRTPRKDSTSDAFITTIGTTDEKPVRPACEACIHH